MKQILLSLFTFSTLVGQAQTVNLSKGQLITITITSTQDMEMTGMQIKNNSTSTSLLQVNDAGKDNFTASYKLDKLNLNMEMMGQQQSFDSEKPEDKESEIGKSFAGKIGKAVPVLINRNTGEVIVKDPEADTSSAAGQENPLEGIMESFGAAGDDATAGTAFFVVPKDKKNGDSWTDSSSTNKMKEVKTYTLKSIDGGIATIQLFSTMQGSSSMETQGMQMDMSLSAKTEGEILVDQKTSLVKKRSSVMDLTGTLDMMGQSVPITSKAIVNITYN